MRKPTLKILKECATHIVQEYLGMQMLYAKWAQRIDGQSGQSGHNEYDQRLNLFNSNKPYFWRQYESMDET